MSTSTPFNFDAAFQREIVAHVIHDKAFIREVAAFLSPELFEDELDAFLISICLDYYAKHKTQIGWRHLLQHVRSLIDQGKVSASLTKRYKSEIEALLKIDRGSRKYVLDEIQSFVRHRAYEDALCKAAEALQKGRYDDVEQIVRDAGAVGRSNVGTDIYDYWKTVDDRKQRRIDIREGRIPLRGITTGIKEFDHFLHQGGWGRQELSLLMGGPKSGKSIALGEFAVKANIGRASASGQPQRGSNVLFITLENSAEIMTNRADACLTETIVRTLNTNAEDVAKKLNAIRANAGLLHVWQAATGTLRVPDIELFLEKQKADGVEYDFVVVDYADLLKPKRRHDQLREESREVYVDLRSIAVRYDLAVLTATQLNRDGSKQMVADSTNVAEDFNKIRIADIIISLNATEDERKNNIARFYIADYRNGRSRISFKVKQDTERMRFVKDWLGEVGA